MKNYITRFINSNYDIIILRLSVIIIFMLFGTYKWFDFEVMQLKPIIGAFGDIIVIVTGIITLSLLLQLNNIDSFTIKDVLLIGAGSVLLKYDLKRSSYITA